MQKSTELFEFHPNQRRSSLEIMDHVSNHVSEIIDGSLSVFNRKPLELVGVEQQLARPRRSLVLEFIEGR